MAKIPPACQGIVQKIGDLEDELKQLQEEKDSRGKPQNPAGIAKQFTKIEKERQKLTNCIREHTPPVVNKTKFEPLKHSFHFKNFFKVDKKEVGLPGEGKSEMGLCGGMCLGALARFHEGRTVPARTEPPPTKGEDSDLFWELVGRQVRTLLPFTWAKVLMWQVGTKKKKPPPIVHTGNIFDDALEMANAGDIVFDLGILDDTIDVLTVSEEWPKVKKCIDKGEPAILVLIRVKGADADPTQNHQVLAIGYSWKEPLSEGTIDIYDPNVPGEVSQLIVPAFTQLNAGKTKGGSPASMGFRGFFVVTL